MNIRKNVGNADRIVRFIVAAVLVGLLVTHTIVRPVSEFIGWAAVVILVITGLDETCPVYLLTGINTRRKRSASHE